MKRSVPLLLLSLILVGCVTPNVPVIEESRYFIMVPKSNEAYHGMAEIKDFKLNRTATGRIVHGKPDGIWTFWDTGGQRIVTFTYRAGILNGPVEMWYTSYGPPGMAGKKKLSGSLSHGRLDGKVTKYSLGQQRLERVLAQGVVQSSREWDVSGAPVPQANAERSAIMQTRADEEYIATLNEVVLNSIKYARHVD